MSLTTYDSVIYDALPHIQCNLWHLETIADLYDLSPPDIHRCRVLEIGTATGKSLLPQAELLPDSVFVGIDLAETQLKIAQDMAEKMELRNVTLRCCSVADIDDSWGEFDYILVHGVYSWVTDEMRLAILKTCQRNLSPNGVAMISYNTLPGWYFNQLARDAMLFHAVQQNQYETPEQTIQQGRAMINLLAKNIAAKSDTSQKGGYYRQFLENIRETLQEHDDYYIYHEFMEVDNEPCTVETFLRSAASHGLSFVSEFDWREYWIWRGSSPLGRDLPAEMAREVAEQYHDYSVNRFFRGSILVKETAIPPAWDHTLRKDITQRYSFFKPMNVRITELPDQNGWTLTRNDTELTLSATPLHATVVEFLHNTAGRHFTESMLQEYVAATIRCDATDNTTRNLPQLSQFMVSQTNNLLVKLLHTQLVFPVLNTVQSKGTPANTETNAETATHFPCVSRFVRELAATGVRAVPNPYFLLMEVDEILRFILRHLDGHHSEEDMVVLLQQALADGEILIFHKDGTPIDHQPETLRHLLQIAMTDIRSHFFLT